MIGRGNPNPPDSRGGGCGNSAIYVPASQRQGGGGGMGYSARHVPEGGTRDVLSGALGNIIFLHIGQAGVQIGHALWELLTLEHGFRPDGKPCYDANSRIADDAVFSVQSSGRGVPRAIFVDLENNCIDDIRSGAYNDLFNPNNLLSGDTDAAGNFGAGFYTAGRDMLPRVMDRLRQTQEECDRLHGLMLVHAMGGGTGSGISAALLNQDLNMPQGSAVVQVTVAPNDQNLSNQLEPYNALLHTALAERSDVNFMSDNQAMYRVLGADIPFGTKAAGVNYPMVNRLLAQAIAHMTATIRCRSNPLQINLADLMTNLVPFKELKYPELSLAPVLRGTGGPQFESSVRSLLNCLTQPNSRFITTPDQLSFDNGQQIEHKNMAVSYVFRGDFNVGETQNACTQELQYGRPFVDWSPKGFRIGLSNLEPYIVPMAGFGQTSKSCLKMASTTAISDVFKRILVRYRSMYETNAFVRTYTNCGVSQEDWRRGGEFTRNLIKHYESMLESSESPSKRSSLRSKSVKSSVTVPGLKYSKPISRSTRSTASKSTKSSKSSVKSTLRIRDSSGAAVSVVPKSIRESSKLSGIQPSVTSSKKKKSTKSKNSSNSEQRQRSEGRFLK